MELSLSELESLANVSGIDDAGLKYLTRVVEGVEEAYADYEGRPDEFSDLIHEIVDSALSVYTYEIWETFIGLSAWEEDVSEYGSPEDMTSAASWAISMIGERAANAIWHKLQEEEEEESDDD